MAANNYFKIASFNCKGFKKRNYNYLNNVFNKVDFLLLQETWLYDYESDVISSQLQNSHFIAMSSMNSQEIRDGRPYGGTAIVWKGNPFYSVTKIDTLSSRLCACKIENMNCNILLMNVYMPIKCTRNDELFVEILHEIISICLMNESFHIILGGDFNCEFDKGDARSKLLTEFKDTLHLYCPESHPFHNVQYTYINTQNQTSFIDHFFVNYDLSSKVTSFYSLDDGDNLSDHCPIIIEIEIDYSRSKLESYSCASDYHNFKVCWEEATSDQIICYKQTLSCLIDNLITTNSCFDCSVFDCKDLSHLTEYKDVMIQFIKAIQMATYSSIPIKYINRNKKKHKLMVGWNSYVDAYRKKSIFWHNLWKDCGRPADGVVSNIRKVVRTNYHVAVKNLKASQDFCIKEKIANALNNGSSKIFWQEINKISKNNKVRPCEVDGSVGIDACNVFKNKYYNLYNEAPDENLVEFLNNMEIEIERACVGSSTSSHLHVISDEMVKKAIGKLNKGKGDVSDLVFTDSFINAPLIVYEFLAKVFSSMLLHGFSCNIFDLIKFSPLIKDKRKSHNDSNNYRAIAINSCVCKILDYVILDYFNDFFNSNDRQFAYKQKCSTTQCTFVLSETVEYYIKRNSKIIVTLIDCSKAFDRVNYKKLFNILYGKGMCPIVCRLMAVMYSSVVAKVEWNGFQSDEFNICSGVKQGGVISPILFNLYTEGLISKIVDSGVGCYVGNVCASILMYADDIALLAPTRGAMQRLLDICSEFGIDNNLCFNPNKSESIVFGNNNYDIKVFLNNRLIPRTNKIKYLGHQLVNKFKYNNDIFDINPTICDIRTRTNVILSYFNFLSFDSKVSIFNSNCSSFYGCVLSNQTNNFLESLDRAWRVSCRKILSLSPRTHCNLIPAIMKTLPPSKQINARTVDFFKNSLNDGSDFVKFFCNNCLTEKSSIICKNLIKISKNLNLFLNY